MPHAPQLVSELLVSTQAPEQFCVGGVQASVQVPAWHTGVGAMQVLPQVPQFTGSEDVSTQLPLQST
jgi:hypothetical protein